MFSFTPSFLYYDVFIKKRLLTLVQLSILLSRLKSWRLGLKAGDLASMRKTGRLKIPRKMFRCLSKHLQFHLHCLFCLCVLRCTCLPLELARFSLCFVYTVSGKIE